MKEQWIKDARAGGYDRRYTVIEKILLDIEAWEAVGTTRKWVHVMNNGSTQPAWRTKMMNFFFRIQKGSTIEEALDVL